MRWIVTGTFSMDIDADEADEATDFVMEVFDETFSSLDMRWNAENVEDVDAPHLDQRQGEDS